MIFDFEPKKWDYKRFKHKIDSYLISWDSPYAIIIWLEWDNLIFCANLIRNWYREEFDGEELLATAKDFCKRNERGYIIIKNKKIDFKVVPSSINWLYTSLYKSSRVTIEFKPD